MSERCSEFQLTDAVLDERERRKTDRISKEPADHDDRAHQKNCHPGSDRKRPGISTVGCSTAQRVISKNAHPRFARPPEGEKEAEREDKADYF